MILQGFIGVGLLVIGLGMLDIKHKLSNLSKLDLVDGLITKLDNAVKDIQDLMTDQAVLESRIKVQIDNLRERLDYLERKVDEYVHNRKD